MPTDGVTAPGAAVPVAGNGGLRRVFRGLGRGAGAFGLVLFALVVLAVLLAPVLTPYSPEEPDLRNRLSPGFWAGNWEHPLGTDELGRDVLARTLYGGRLSLMTGLAVVACTAVLGTVIGAVSGFYGGRLDLIAMRVMDLLMVLPDLVLAMVVIAILGRGLDKAMVAIVVVYTPRMARLVRGNVLAMRSAEFVQAARAQGAGSLRILWRHVLPNALPPSIVFLTLLLGDAVLYAAGLGFLGLGAQPPAPEWGAMLSSARDLLVVGQWWAAAAPGAAIAVTVLSLNLLGDTLRDILDPRSRIT